MEPLRGPMARRTVLVTGASADSRHRQGHHRLGLARMGAHLAIVGRDRDSTQGAAGGTSAAVDPESANRQNR
jgi:hypothetical protein